MKTMTCKQLGGPCDQQFHANTFEEIVEKSKNHGMEMYQRGDAAHIEVMSQMKKNMKTQSPEAMQEWFENKRKQFNALPSSS